MLSFTQIIFFFSSPPPPHRWIASRWEFAHTNVNFFFSLPFTDRPFAFSYLSSFHTGPICHPLHLLKLQTKKLLIPRMRFGLITGLLIPTNGEDTNDKVPQIGKVEEKRVESTGCVNGLWKAWILISILALQRDNPAQGAVLLPISPELCSCPSVGTEVALPFPC